jgi:hypothetical protein
VYEIEYNESDPQIDFFFRIDDKGYPVIVNRAKKAIVFMKDNNELDFSSFVYAPGDAISNIFDISVSDSVVKFVGITGKNNCVKGFYCIKDKKLAITKFNNNIVYQSMKINGNSILACRKDEETNELVLDQFSF